MSHHAKNLSKIHRDDVNALLAEITGLPDMEEVPDLDLFEEGVLDSLGLVRLLVELSTRFGIELTPADIQREEWSTPRRILQSIELNLTA